MLKCGKCRKNVYVVFAQIISLVKLRLKNIVKRFAIVVSTGKSRREKYMVKEDEILEIIIKGDKHDK